MRRHEIDAVSLVAGLLFLVVAAVHITARATDTDLNLRWMVPAVLVLLGLLGLLGAIRSPRGTPVEVADPAERVEVAAHAKANERGEVAGADEPTERVAVTGADEPTEHVEVADHDDPTEPVERAEPVEPAVLDEADEAATER